MLWRSLPKNRELGSKKSGKAVQRGQGQQHGNDEQKQQDKDHSATKKWPVAPHVYAKLECDQNNLHGREFQDIHLQALQTRRCGCW